MNRQLLLLPTANPISAALIAALVLVAPLLACNNALTCTTPPNPSGNCSTPANGDHKGYSSAPACAWIRDCNLQLSREYWRAYVEEADGTAYLIPRPDGTPCLPAAKRQMPAINALTPAEALAAAHCLHQSLRFAAAGQGTSWDVTPTAMPDDVAEVCRLSPTLATGSLQNACSRCEVKANLQTVSGGCPSLYVPLPTQAEAEQLALGLNQIYGIKP